MSNKPIYVKVYDDIKKKIVEGVYSIGDFLPSEPEFEKSFNVSRTTVRKSMDMLAREQFIEVRQGRGTQVLDYRTRQNLNHVTSISETLKQKGYIIDSKNMYIDSIFATASLAADLNIEIGEKLVRIQRIQCVDGKPMVIMRNFLAPSSVPNIELFINKFHSLYKFLEEKYGINIDSAKDTISAKASNFEESTMLNIAIGSAMLYIKRISYEKNIPICADRVCIIGEKYELEVNMFGREK